MYVSTANCSESLRAAPATEPVEAGAVVHAQAAPPVHGPRRPGRPRPRAAARQLRPAPRHAAPIPAPTNETTASCRRRPTKPGT